MTRPTGLRIVVVTVVSGRHDHLRAQLAALARHYDGPSRHVVVSMADPDVPAVVTAAGPAPYPVDVVTVDRWADGLPLARARNTGAAEALEVGADLLVFLDVDCVPGPRLLPRYAAAAQDHALLCGPVTYLEAGASLADDDLAAATAPHAARPDPPDGQVVVDATYELFWSLSFAVTPSTWREIGGFDEGYVGYGGEDTDFAYRAEEAGVALHWVGGAHAYHQHHAVSSPPVEHLTDIVRNAQRFRRRWGVWPMAGWLSAFEEEGLLRRAEDSIELTGQPFGRA